MGNLLNNNKNKNDIDLNILSKLLYNEIIYLLYVYNNKIDKRKYWFYSTYTISISNILYYYYNNNNLKLTNNEYLFYNIYSLYLKINNHINYKEQYYYDKTLLSSNNNEEIGNYINIISLSHNDILYESYKYVNLILNIKKNNKIKLNKLENDLYNKLEEIRMSD